MSDIGELARRMLDPRRGYPRLAGWLVLTVVAAIVAALVL